MRQIARMLPPESASAQEVAQEFGISVSTMGRWHSEALAQSEGKKVWALTDATIKAFGSARALKAGMPATLARVGFDSTRAPLAERVPDVCID